jgi:hypothetical protein
MPPVVGAFFLRAAALFCTMFLRQTIAFRGLSYGSAARETS